MSSKWLLLSRLGITLVLLGMILYGWTISAQTGERIANWEAAVIGAIVGYWLNDGETVATRLQENGH